MPAVKEKHFTGGSNVAPNPGAADADLATILRGVADDLADRSGIASADASDLATAITLVNEIKAALNNSVRTTKG